MATKPDKNDSDILVCARIDRSLYEKLCRRRKEVRDLTGTEPSVSALIRASLERDLAETIEQRRRTKPRRAAA